MKKYIDYAEYIQSDSWREKRRKYFDSGMPQQCFGCQSLHRKGIHLHHKTYQRLGNEKLHDLVPLCEKCHEYVHFFAKKNPQLDLWVSSNRAIKRLRKGNNIKLGKNSVRLK